MKSSIWGTTIPISIKNSVWHYYIIIKLFSSLCYNEKSESNTYFPYITILNSVWFFPLLYINQLPMNISGPNFPQKVPLGYAIWRLKIVEIRIQLFKARNIQYVNHVQYVISAYGWLLIENIGQSVRYVIYQYGFSTFR